MDYNVLVPSDFANPLQCRARFQGTHLSLIKEAIKTHGALRPSSE
jgi:hypothetical protein